MSRGKKESITRIPLVKFHCGKILKKLPWNKEDRVEVINSKSIFYGRTSTVIDIYPLTHLTTLQLSTEGSSETVLMHFSVSELKLEHTAEEVRELKEKSELIKLEHSKTE